MAIIGTLMSAAALCTASMTPHWPLGAILVVAAVYGISAAGYLPVLLGEVAGDRRPVRSARSRAARSFSLSAEASLAHSHSAAWPLAWECLPNSFWRPRAH